MNHRFSSIRCTVHILGLISVCVTYELYFRHVQVEDSSKKQIVNSNNLSSSSLYHKDPSTKKQQQEESNHVMKGGEQKKKQTKEQQHNNKTKSSNKKKEEKMKTKNENTKPRKETTRGVVVDNTLRLRDLENKFDCKNVMDKQRPIHSQSTWITMRQIYHDIVGSKLSTIGGHPSDTTNTAVSNSSQKFQGSGWRVPIRVQHNSKGRGVYYYSMPPTKKRKNNKNNDDDNDDGISSSSNNNVIIRKGTLLWTANDYTACFTKGQHFRQFLFSLPFPDLACDIMEWAYVAKFNSSDLFLGTNKEKAYLCVELDEGALLNTGRRVYEYDDDDKEVQNAGCVDEETDAKDHLGGCSMNYFALRDIHIGEEILISYGEFAISNGWKWFGLRRR